MVYSNILRKCICKVNNINYLSHVICTSLEFSQCIHYYPSNAIHSGIHKINSNILCHNTSINKPLLVKITNSYKSSMSNIKDEYYLKKPWPTKTDVTMESKNIEYGNRTSVAQSLVDASPSQIQPHLRLMRLDRPIGTWLLYWPCAWSIALAAPPGSFPDVSLLALFAAGALVMRGAGCTVNDMWDREFDYKVSRTAQRPLASGTLSMFDAVVMLGMQLGLGCLILLQLNWYSILLGASSLGLIGLYPLMKRVSYWPQLMLGFTFNWGALLGYSAVHGHCNWVLCLPLYSAGVAWTLIYDTIYAHQDKSDDIAIGIKSTALKFGDQTPLWLSGFGCVMMSSLVASGWKADMAVPYYIAVAVIAVHVFMQIKTLDIHDPKNCAQKFRSNRNVGLLLFLGIVTGIYLKESKEEEADKVPLKDS